MSIGNWIINSEKRTHLLAVEYKKDRQWLKFNWPEYIGKVVSAYAALKSAGLKKNHTSDS